MGLPENKIVLILSILADILISIVREITSLAVSNSDDQRPAGIASVTLLCVICLVFFPGTNMLLFLIEYKLKSPDKAAVCRQVFVNLFQSFAAGLYFYGDNINDIIQSYGGDLGCGDQCATNNQIAASVLLGVALIINQLFPQTLSQLNFIFSPNDKKSKWYSSLDMITLILKVDIIYTSVSIMSQTQEYCGHLDVALSAAFITICIIIGIGIMVVNCLYAIRKIDEDGPKKYLPFFCAVIAFSFILFMLADNSQPLDCAFDCDTFAANQTLNEINCNVEGNSGLRLAFLVVAFAIIATVSFFLIYKGIQTDDEDEGTDTPKSPRVYNLKQLPT